MVVAYILGSISPSVLLGRLLRGIDIREHGSGNAGTSNAFRVLGWRLGTAVLAGDVMKGFLPVLAALYLSVSATVVVIVGLAAIAGHNWSILLRARGGKGVATGAGVLLAMMPLNLAVLVTAWGIIFAATGVVSAASITVTALLPVLTFSTGQPRAYLAFAVVAAALVLWAHRGNMVRLVRREERRTSLPWSRRKEREEGNREDPDAVQNRRVGGSRP